MSGSLNQVQLIGNLAKDPEIRSFDNGGKICNLRLITSESWTDKQSGERQQRIEGHSVVIHNERIIEVAEKYLKKGSKVFIQGSLRTRKWQDKDGNDRYNTEIDLARYNGVLTMLSTAGSENDDNYYDSNGGNNSRGNDNRGGGNRAPSSYNRNNDRNDDRGNNRGNSNNTRSYEDDLDDDVPF